MRITIVGGTGYTGHHLAVEAARRGHSVTSFSRGLPSEPVDGVQYRTGSVFDAGFLQDAVADAEVVVLALSPRGELEDSQTEVYARLAELADAAGARLFVIGGFSTLRPAPGQPRFVEGDLNPAFAKEALTGGANLDLLRSTPDSLDWVYVSPAAAYGAYAPGEPTGRYRKGGEVAQFDADGNSTISGADFAQAVVDAIEAGTDHRAHISFVS
jgi:putative NADH-flavin reductase